MLSRARLTIGLSLTVIIVALGWFVYDIQHNKLAEPPELQAFNLEKRPQVDRYLFDYANILGYYEEAAHKYLRNIDKQFHIESLIVSIPTLPAGHSLEEFSVDLVNHWRIGEQYEGRGLLLLLVDEQKQVKLEVSYELEDVFTDAFTGYVEDLQLKPYFLNNDIGTGLIAVMEELEQRAQIKHQADYKPGTIARLDKELLAGGAGATRSLKDYNAGEKTALNDLATPGRGARSPEEAWEIMLTKWAGKGKHIDVDIYTAMTRLAMGDPDNPDPRTKKSLAHWRDTKHVVLQDENHAVIYFGNKKGWENAPFLFCRTTDGWKFDIVYQRRLVVMSSGTKWKIEQGNYPYVNLLSKAPQSIGKDLPLPAGDHYSCGDDAEIGRKMSELEKIIQREPGNYSATMELMRLNVITGRRPNHVQPLLQRLKKHEPDNPDTYKYSAIYNVNTFFQYKTALKDMQVYRNLRPQDPFAHNFIGFLYYRLKMYEDSIKALEKSIMLETDNSYAYALLARNYASLSRDSRNKSRKEKYRELSMQMFEKSAQVPTPDIQRLAWLRSWLAWTLAKDKS